MATTAQNIYDDVCRMLLEDGGFQYVYTQAAFLKDLAVCLAEFLQATGIVKDFYTVTIVPGTSVYDLPVTGMDVQAVYADGVFLYNNSSFYIDHSNSDWELDTGMPTQWKQDQLDANKIQVTPTPTRSGVLTIVATAQPTTMTLTLGSTLQCIPDSLTHYLTFATLAKIWESDSEAKDVQRARYANTRRVEGVNLCKAIMKEDLLERQ